jgi:integrase
LLQGEDCRGKAFVLLMLNTGCGSKDLSDLAPAEIRNGYIIRKRSKTKKKDSTPIVHYKLWPETARLLEKFRNGDKAHVFLTTNGTPLCPQTLADDTGKIHNSDMATKAVLGYLRKMKSVFPVKLLRKTSSTLLWNNPTHRPMAQLFLGHSPGSIAESNYCATDPTALDEAIDYLASVYGLSTPSAAAPAVASNTVSGAAAPAATPWLTSTST